MPPGKRVGKKAKPPERALVGRAIKPSPMFDDPVVMELNRLADALPMGSRKRLRLLVTARKIVSGEGGRKYYELIQKKFGVRLH